MIPASPFFDTGHDIHLHEIVPGPSSDMSPTRAQYATHFPRKTRWRDQIDIYDCFRKCLVDIGLGRFREVKWKAGVLGFEATKHTGQRRGDRTANAVLTISYDFSPCCCHVTEITSKCALLSRFCPDEKI